MMEKKASTNLRRRRLCGHRGEELSYSAYLSHRRLYFNSAKNKWLTSLAAAQEVEEVIHPQQESETEHEQHQYEQEDFTIGIGM